MFAQCTQSIVVNSIRTYAQLATLLEVAQGDPSPGFSLTPSDDSGDPPHTFDFTINFDADLDGDLDTNITGKITFPDDPASGIAVGSDMPTTYTLGPLGTSGPLDGTGQITLTLSQANQFTITGQAALSVNTDNCGASMSFPGPTPLVVGLPSSVASAPSLQADVLGIEVYGTYQSHMEAQGRVFDGTIDVSRTTQEATMNGSFDGGEDRQLSFSIFPDDLQIFRLQECFSAQAKLVDSLNDVFAALARIVDDANGDVTAIPQTPGLTLETSGTNRAAYEINLAQFPSTSELTGGTLRGEVRTTLLNFAVTSNISWQLDGQVGEATVTGKSARFYVVSISSTGDPTSHGAGALGQLNCIGNFEIPEDDPLRGFSDSGTIILDSTVGNDTLSAEMTVEFGNATSVRSWINGIPVPPGLVIDF
jgi:hypothetical protein